jgi:hypothetical protein
MRTGKILIVVAIAIILCSLSGCNKRNRSESYQSESEQQVEQPVARHESIEGQFIKSDQQKIQLLQKKLAELPADTSRLSDGQKKIVALQRKSFEQGIQHWQELIEDQKQDTLISAMVKADEVMFPHLRQASVDDYKKWLAGFLKTDGLPSHYYDYPFNKTDWYVATSDLEIFPLYGSASVNIIVPAGITVSDTGLGHNNLYFMKDFSTRGHFVPVFKDTQL